MNDELEMINALMSEMADDEPVLIKVVSLDVQHDEKLANLKPFVEGVTFVNSTESTNVQTLLENVSLLLLLSENSNQINQIAEIAASKGILTFVPVVQSFSVDNTNFVELCHSDVSKSENQRLVEIIKNFIDLLVKSGMININLQDIKETLALASTVNVAVGSGEGKHRANQTIEQALNLVDIKQAKSVVVAISAANVEMEEFDVVGQALHESLNENATVKIGLCGDEQQAEKMTLTVFVTL
jgi:hypothetical protein